MAKTRIQRNHGSTPSIVRKRQDHLARLQGDPNAPTAGGKQYAHESDGQFNHRAGFVERSTDQILTPQRNAMADPGRRGFRPHERLVDQAVAMVGSDGLDAGRRGRNGKEFFDNDPTMTMASQRGNLNRMGPEGQATLTYMENQMRQFKAQYAEELARNNRPDLTEDDLARMAQSLEAYDEGMFDDASAFVQGNLPKGIQEQRKQKAAMRVKIEQVAESSQDSNYQTIKNLLGEDMAERFKEAGFEVNSLGDTALSILESKNGFLLDSFGQAIPHDPARQAERELVIELHKGEQIAKQNREQARIDRGIERAEQAAAEKAAREANPDADVSTSVRGGDTTVNFAPKSEPKAPAATPAQKTRTKKVQAVHDDVAAYQSKVKSVEAAGGKPEEIWIDGKGNLTREEKPPSARWIKENDAQPAMKIVSERARDLGRGRLDDIQALGASHLPEEGAWYRATFEEDDPKKLVEAYHKFLAAWRPGIDLEEHGADESVIIGLRDRARLWILPQLD